MKIEKYRYIVSLGETCQTAYQIKRYFKIGHSNFFDFKKTSLECLTSLISQDFHDLLLPGNLSVTPSGEHVKDAKYNLLMRHEFRNNQEVISENFMELYPAVKQKCDYLIGKFRSILDSRESCLFVYARERQCQDNYCDLKAALELEAAIKKRAPRLGFKILYVDALDRAEIYDCGEFSTAIPYDKSLEEKDIFYLKSRYPTRKERWKGSDLAWDQIFAGYRKKQERWNWSGKFFNHSVKLLVSIKNRVSLSLNQGNTPV